MHETSDQHQERRSAVRTICRLSTGLESPDKLSRDARGAVLVERVVQLRHKGCASLDERFDTRRSYLMA